MVAGRLKILVVDDEPAIREVLEMRLGRQGHEVLLAASGAEARRLVEQEDPDLVISDVVLPDLSGLELVRGLQGGTSGYPVILITAYGTIDIAVEAMKLGALDFLTKPLDHSKLGAILEAATAEIERRRRTRRLEQRLAGDCGLGALIGTSRAMRETYRLLELLADSDAPAILAGESGTGKELAARTVHQLSGRRDGPFFAVNTAAIAEGVTESELFGHEKGAFTGASRARSGYFELADGGTLLLDEIGEMPGPLQAKLLRVLEDGLVRRVGGRRETRVDVRVLAATNRQPRQAVEEGRLREDLFYRLSVFTIELPPLRRRGGDVALLCQHFVRELDRKHGTTVAGVGEAALERLRAYAWPGNVRELRNVLERAVILARQGWIEPLHLPPFLRGEPAGRRRGLVLPPDVTAAEAERLLILETLERHGNNKTRAARALGLDVKTVRNKLRAYEREARQAR